MAQYWLCSCGPLSPQFTGWTQDLVFDSDLTSISCWRVGRVHLALVCSVALSFRFPPDPQNGFSVASSTHARAMAFGKGTCLCPGVKNPGSNRCRIRASGLD